MLTTANIWAQFRDAANQNVWELVGSGAPTNGTSGTGAGLAGPGSTYTDTATGNIYTNTNTKASPTWSISSLISATGDVTFSGSGVATIASQAVTSGKIANNTITSGNLSTSLLQYATGNITSANITGTSAGQLGHANGVVIQATPGANKALQLVSFGLYYTFAAASYTGGGNISVNWGAGGAALTGVVSYANSVGAASSKGVMFYPLSTAGVAIVSNASLNLVAASAPTQPGTAAGTIVWEIWYRVMSVGF